jgi:adenylate kinase
MNYFIGGINGTGKTTLISEIVKLRPSYISVQHTKTLMKWLGIDSNYDKLRSMDQDYINSKLDPEFVKYLLQNNISKTILLDSHFTNLIKGQFFKATEGWIANFDALILVTAPINEIHNRITIDQRDRELFPPNSNLASQLKYLEKYSEVEKMEFLRLTKKYKKPHLIIQNRKNKLQKAIELFLKFEDLILPNK